MGSDCVMSIKIISAMGQTTQMSTIYTFLSANSTTKKKVVFTIKQFKFDVTSSIQFLTRFSFKPFKCLCNLKNEIWKIYFLNTFVFFCSGNTKSDTGWLAQFAVK